MSYICKLRGCNYYAVKSEQDFKKRMDTEFDFMVTPLVFDLTLRLKSEGNSCSIQNVFGSGDEDDAKESTDNENESLNYEVMNVKTLFPSKQENGQTKGGIILIQLKKTDTNKGDAMYFEIEVSYKDKMNKVHKNEQFVSFGGDKDDVNDEQYFDNNGIRKGILLSRFVSLIKQWIQNDNNAEKPLTVSSEYKQKFIAFTKYFQSEMKVLGDDSLSKELDILCTITGLEIQEPLAKPAAIKLFEYNQDNGAGYYHSAKQGILSMKYPIMNGIVSSWDDAEKLWHNALYNELRVAPEEHLVIMSEKYKTPKANREKKTLIMFETFNVPAFYLTNSLFLSLYATGRENGVCVDFGFEQISIAPMYAGCVLSNAFTRLNVGGRHITQYLNQLLMKSGISFTTSMEKEIVRDIKEQTAFVHDGQSDEEKECSVEYKLPTNDAVISIDSERWRCCEVLFDPKLIDVEEYGVDKLIFDAVMKCDANVREELFANIVLTGATSVLPGLGDRIVNGLRKLVPDSVVVQIAQTSDHQKKNGVFIGASLLSQEKDFMSRCIVKDEYDEFGPTLIHKKCLQ